MNNETAISYIPTIFSVQDYNNLLSDNEEAV